MRILLYLCTPIKQTLFFMFIIGIAGGTGSGKTTVVRKLIERLPKGEVVVIPQDSYYKAVMFPSRSVRTSTLTILTHSIGVCFVITFLC